MEVAVHVEPHDAEVVGARDVGDDAFPALPLLRHPHPHVPVPELGRGNCYSHSALGTGCGSVAIHGPFWVPTPGPAPLAPALWMVMCLLKSLPGPVPCLGILPSISTGIAPPGTAHPGTG